MATDRSILGGDSSISCCREVKVRLYFPSPAVGVVARVDVIAWRLRNICMTVRVAALSPGRGGGGRDPDERTQSLTHRLVDQRETGVGAVKCLVGAAAAAAVQRHAAREVELAGGLWVLFGNLHAHFSGQARRLLDLLQDDCQTQTFLFTALLHTMWTLFFCPALFHGSPLP